MKYNFIQDKIVFADLTNMLHVSANAPGPHGMRSQEIRSKKTNEPTWGVMGVLWQLHKIIRNKPRKVMVYLDHPENGFRQQLCPSYKRKKSSFFISSQQNRLLQCLPALGIPVGIPDEPGMEAEDAIAVEVQKYKSHGNCLIYGNDKDLLQLVDPAVELFMPNRHKLVNQKTAPEEIMRILHTQVPVPPSMLPAALALIGDDSDGVPGIPGVGPKYFSRMYRQFPHINDAREFLQSIEPHLNTQYTLALDNLALVDLKSPRHQQMLIHYTEPAPKEVFHQVMDELTIVSLNTPEWMEPFFQQAQAQQDFPKQPSSPNTDTLVIT